MNNRDKSMLTTSSKSVDALWDEYEKNIKPDYLVLHNIFTQLISQEEVNTQEKDNINLLKQAKKLNTELNEKMDCFCETLRVSASYNILYALEQVKQEQLIINNQINSFLNQEKFAVNEKILEPIYTILEICQTNLQILKKMDQTASSQESELVKTFQAVVKSIEMLNNNIQRLDKDIQILNENLAINRDESHKNVSEKEKNKMFIFKFNK